MEERITVGGEDNLVRLEVERDGADMLSRNGEPVDYAIGNVLISHGLYHVGKNDHRMKSPGHPSPHLFDTPFLSFWQH